MVVGAYMAGGMHGHPAGTSVISSLNDKINNFCPIF